MIDPDTHRPLADPTSQPSPGSLPRSHPVSPSIPTGGAAAAAAPPRPARRARAAVLVLAVLAAHALLLGGLTPGLGGGQVEGIRPVLETRQIVRTALPETTAADLPAPAPPEAPATPATPAPPGAPVPATPPAEAASAPPPLSPEARSDRPSEPVAAAAAPAAASEPAPPAGTPPEDQAAAPAGPASAPLGPAWTRGGEALPVYATRLPPAARLPFELRRGLLSGDAVLDWRPGPEGYELTLEARAFGQTLLAWHSRGVVDGDGVAPQRFTDRRGRRAALAANFRRDVGLLSYSASTVEFPLPRGAQDRLSWMVQLAGILEAEPRLREPGQRISILVTGARADADVWTFVVQGRSALELPVGTVPEALHLLRAPRKAFDTQAEAWLDPARGHLPVRARLATPDSGEATDLLLVPARLASPTP